MNLSGEELSECSYIDEFRDPTVLAQLGAFIVVIVTSTFGNLVVIRTIFSDADMKSTYCNIFIVNLALCDIVQSTIGVPTMASTLVMTGNRWVIPWRLSCQLGRAINMVVPAAASFTHVVIAIDRYIAIVRPFRERLSLTLASLIMIGIWALGTLFGLVDFVNSIVVTDPRGDCIIYICYITMSQQQLSRELGVYVVLVFLVPLTCILLVYCRTCYELWAREGIGESGNQRQVNVKRRVVKMMVLVVVAFAATRLPLFCVYVVMLSMPGGGNMPLIGEVTTAVSWIYCCSTVFNPTIYAVMNNKFRAQFRAVLCCEPITTVRGFNPSMGAGRGGRVPLGSNRSNGITRRELNGPIAGRVEVHKAPIPFNHSSGPSVGGATETNQVTQSTLAEAHV